MRGSGRGIAMIEIVARRRLIENAGNGSQDGILVFPGDLHINDHFGGGAQKQDGEDTPRIGHFFSHSKTDHGLGRLREAHQLGGWSQVQPLFPRDTKLSLLHFHETLPAPMCSFVRALGGRVTEVERLTIYARRRQAEANALIAWRLSRL
jgi:hypothetical protein